MAASDRQQSPALYYCRFHGCPSFGSSFSEGEIIRHANLEHADRGPAYRRDECQHLFDEIIVKSGREPSPLHDGAAKEGMVGLPVLSLLET